MIDEIVCGDALSILQSMPSESINCCITSPPYYGLRDYGIDGQIGLEQNPDEYITKLVEIFKEVKRVLKNDGTLWLNIGDSYAGSWGNAGNRPELDKRPSYQREKNTDYFARGGWDQRREVPPNAHVRGCKKKDLIGIPWMAAFALRADGWYLRSDIIWHKPNCMPESVTDRPTKAHEYIFLLSKSKKYYYDAEAVKESNVSNSPRTTKNGEGNGELGHGHFGQSPNGRNKRTVWTIPTKPYKEAHFATFPEKLIEPCVLAGCPEGGIILDPFIGSGTTGAVAKRLGRHFIGIDMKPDYCQLAESRIAKAEASL